MQQADDRIQRVDFEVSSVRYLIEVDDTLGQTRQTQAQCCNNFADSGDKAHAIRPVKRINIMRTS